MTFDEWVTNQPIHPILDHVTTEWMREAWNAATMIEREACANECSTKICGSMGFAGPSRCVLPRGHSGRHNYGIPAAKTGAQCAADIRAMGNK